MNIHQNILHAIEIAKLLGLPQAQQNARTALCLLALLDLTPGKDFHLASCPTLGITPIMQFSKIHYQHIYAPNTRETFRRQSIHQLIQAGIVVKNPDNPNRPINSPNTVYQLAESALNLIKCYGSEAWDAMLKSYLAENKTLDAIYKKERLHQKSSVRIKNKHISLSPGKHNDLIKAIIEEFRAQFLPTSNIVYVGDTMNKTAYRDKKLLKRLHISCDEHGKLPDVILFVSKENWWVVVESVTSHGHISAKRNIELEELLKDSTADKIYVSAFPDKTTMKKYISDIAWETEVWIADNPTHLIHLNGTKFLRPFKEQA